MKRIYIKDLFDDTSRYSGKSVTVAGWVKTIRSSNAFGFIELNDGSYLKNLQIVFESDKLDNYKEIAAQNIGAAFIIEGILVETPESRQPFELKASRIEIEGTSTPDYPLQKKRHSPEYLRTIAHLRSRTNMIGAALRVRSAAAFAIHKFFNERNFVYIHTPIITGADCEGAGEMFRVTTFDPAKIPLTQDGVVDYNKDFFGKETNLTVSGQLNAECFAMSYANVYTFGPTFRAEASNTTTHAAEFWMIEPEIAFADLADDMRLAWDMLTFVVRHVLEACPADIEFCNEFIDKNLRARLEKLVASDIKAISYTEAVNILSESGEKFEYPVKWGLDLQTCHERYLTEKIFDGPVFITDYPAAIKAFYMRRNDDNKTVAAMDLLVPGVGELIGGSQREERYDRLANVIKEFGLNKEDYWWYLELRKYGSTKHAGFGLGFERLIMYLTGINNIRDVCAFPRTSGKAEF